MCLERTGEMVTERGMWRHGVARYVAWPEISCNVRPEFDRPSHLLPQLSSSASPTSRPSLFPTTWFTSPTTCGPRRWQDNNRTTLLAWSLPTTILSLPHPTVPTTDRPLRTPTSTPISTSILCSPLFEARTTNIPINVFLQCPRRKLRRRPLRRRSRRHRKQSLPGMSTVGDG